MEIFVLNLSAVCLYLAFLLHRCFFYLVITHLVGPLISPFWSVGNLFQDIRVSSISEAVPVRASSPPRGWNSYDSFCWTISEEEFLQSAEIISQRLRPHGYEYVVVDYLWYRRKVKGAYVDSLGFDVIDEWGRMIPDPDRWPSSRGGKGFTEVAKKVHAMGLKFGIHVMRGISTQAFNADTPILDTVKGGAYEDSGRQWRAKDIGLKERACAWMQHGFMSVNTKLGAGRAFLRSLYQQYAEWGVDFVKHDCVFGDDLNINEISFVSEVLKELDRPIVYSLSPGTGVTPAMAKEVSGLVNMYRITGDDWDTWGDVAAHFNVSRDFSAANMIGAKGLQGKSWPDLDMLPLGWLTDPGYVNWKLVLSFIWNILGPVDDSGIDDSGVAYNAYLPLSTFLHVLVRQRNNEMVAANSRLVAQHLSNISKLSAT